LPADWRPRALEWVNGAKVSALDDAAKDRLGKLLLRTGAWLEEGRIGLVAAERMMDWLEPLLRRQSYLALLQERPSTHQRLLRLLGAARWPAKYLIQHPGVIDELASAEMLDERFDAAQLRAELTQRRQALQRSGEDDEERLLDLLRRAHHAEVFRTLARDVEGRITVEAVADDLSALAQVLLQVAVEWSWQHFKGAHRDQPQIGIIAYGKWGGQELGYGSDLDIVFVFDDDAPQAAEIYAAWVRKLISWLTVKTAEGDLFEIDTALRPNGNAGLLVSPFEAFSDYQLQRGSNTAWTWEHQAITRARLVVGEERLQTQFEAVRAGVMTAPREAQALRDEIVAMRAKVAAAHKVPAGRFDVKHSPGGMVDIEFAVQTLLLLHSQSHPELLRNAGNIGLLLEAQRSGLLPSPVGEQAANAYRALRLAQHKARLDEAATHMDPADWQGHINAVRALWQCALETALDR
jgi:glutamate-ammonia-ligase adenylyltransferase